MSGEARLWDDWRKCLVKADPGCDLTRIENAVQLGTPDVNGCCWRTDFWCELKSMDRWPKDPAKPLLIPHYTRNQRLWIRRRGRAGGRVFLLLRVTLPVHEWLLFGWEAAYAQVGNVPADALRSVALMRCLGKFDPAPFRLALKYDAITNPLR